MQQLWHTKSIPQTFRILETNKKGLTELEARKRIKRYGLNVLPTTKADSSLTIFVRQFRSPLIYLLLVASITIYLLGEITDSIIIILVLVFNAIVGAIQEGKAQNTLRALQQFVATKAVVVRNGLEMIVADTEVVPGDLIVLHEGDKVPADSRVISSNGLTLDEASLTGESVPVHKHHEILDQATLSVSEQKNIVFKGTHVVASSGQAVVVATGSNTVIGKISQTLTTIDSQDPLKASLAKLSTLLIVVVGIISVTLLSIGLLQGRSFTEMFAVVISLAVSIIPEGLPIVMTLVLATGVWRMSKRHALVKKLQAVESLGQAEIIAVDKTGTLTKNEMTVQKVFTGGKLFDITGAGYTPKGQALLHNRAVIAHDYPELETISRLAAFCANSRATLDEQTNQWQVSGDPTEAALVVFAEKLGIEKSKLERTAPLLAELPFSSQTKYHATLHKQGNYNILVAVGAPEVVIKQSTTYLDGIHRQPLAAKDKKTFEKIIARFSEQGLRVLAIAREEKSDATISVGDIQDLSLVGLLGIRDALRPEVRTALTQARAAGMRVVMITGDHVITARTIAQEAGIYKSGDTIITGEELESLSVKQLARKLAKTSVFARVTPEHKLKIIQAYQHQGKIIAMTGDGVNDAPSLVAADLGVAMGTIGTEVAKEAADIILLDDNFGSIVAAVEEGRSIYRTIKKVILYLFSTSVGEVLTIGGALLIGLPIPITASQIIWLNFVTDGFLDIALAMEPKDKDLLSKRYGAKTKSLVDSLMLKRIITMAIPMAIGTLALFSEFLGTTSTKAWTISLTTLAIFQWFNVWNCRHESKSLFSLNPFSNRYLLGATALVVVLQLIAVYAPFMHHFLRTTSLSLHEWIICIAVASSIVIVEEIRKAIIRAKSTA